MEIVFRIATYSDQIIGESGGVETFVPKATANKAMARERRAVVRSMVVIATDGPPLLR